MPVDYSNTLIYKIVCNDSLVADFYLGYTTLGYRVLCDRFKQRCKKSKWFVCEFIRNHGGFQNWNIERLAIMSLCSAVQARIELRKHFDADPPTLNRHLPTRTAKEYAQTERNKEVQKLYRQEHPEERRLEQQRQYQQKQREATYKKKRILSSQ